MYPNAAATWKQEVNQRLAAHRSRRSLLTGLPAEPALNWTVSKGSESLVAARVAARYASVPSYSELHGDKAPVAPRAAAVAPPAALEPRVEPRFEPRVFETPRSSTPVVSASLPTARTAEPAVQPPVVSASMPERTRIPSPELLPASPALTSVPHQPPESLEAWENDYAQNAWRPDPGLRPVLSDVVRSPRPARMDEFVGAQGPVAVEPDQPIHANLIEFPREVVAARKMRPRRAERAFAADGIDRQLSIFEVDPGAYAAPSEAEAEPTAAAWLQPEWSGIRLEAQAQREARQEERSDVESDVRLAPVGHRLMAVLVDGALITAAFIALAIVAATGAGNLPTSRAVVLGAASMLMLIALLYQTLFLLLAEATPGMRYAGISLCTFDSQIPTPAQLRSRLGALLLSVVPICLGVAWALFDEDHLCWHDRLSRTYLRKD